LPRRHSPPRPGARRTSDASSSRRATATSKIGGLTQFDGRFFVADANDPKVDQFGFRSIRPDLNATVLDHYDFRLLSTRRRQAGAARRPRRRPLHRGDQGPLRQVQGADRLERAQADVATTFVERGLPSQLTPNRDRRDGVRHAADGVVAYYAGVFNGVADNASGDGDVNNDKEAAARVFVKPFARGDTIAKGSASEPAARTAGAPARSSSRGCGVQDARARPRSSPTRRAPPRWTP
jgi:phosphate-selective porin OprO/OprP